VTTCDAAREIATLTTASAGIAFVLIMGEAGRVQSTRPRASGGIRPGTGFSSEVSHSGSGAGDEFELGIRKLQKGHPRSALHLTHAPHTCNAT
jgi:hypothetical protein